MNPAVLPGAVPAAPALASLPLPSAALADGTHLLSGIALALGFVLLYQRRPPAMVRTYAAQALAAALVAGWHGWHMASLPALLGGTLLLAGVAAMRAVLRRRSGAGHGEAVPGAPAVAEPGGTVTMAVGIATVALAVAAVQAVRLPPVGAATPTREDMAFALSISLLGLLAAAGRVAPLGRAVALLSMLNGAVILAAGSGGMVLLAAGASGLLAPAAALLVPGGSAARGGLARRPEGMGHSGANGIPVRR